MHFLIPFLRTEMAWEGARGRQGREGGEAAKRWLRRSNEKNLGIGHTDRTRNRNRIQAGLTSDDSFKYSKEIERKR